MTLYPCVSPHNEKLIFILNKNALKAKALSSKFARNVFLSVAFQIKRLFLPARQGKALLLFSQEKALA
jgi:hypothetical protein